MAAKGYDYIIVGAGSAGCVLAGRLTEDGTKSVLLLEAGGRDNHPYIKVPLGLGKLHDHKMFDWGYDYEAEPALGGREVEAMRGKVLGGPSTINVMAYVRGNRGATSAGSARAPRVGAMPTCPPTSSATRRSRRGRTPGVAAKARRHRWPRARSAMG